MRLFIVKISIVCFLLLSASSASAINLFMSNLSSNTLNIGETFTIELRVSTEGTTGINVLEVSVQVADPSIAGFVSGVGPPTILTNTTSGYFENLPQTAPPQDGIPGDAPGRVRAATYTSAPTNTGASANQLLATLTFIMLAPGITTIDPLVQLGTHPDTVYVNSVDVTALVTTSPGPWIGVIPEPGTALLLGLGLAGLASTGRRRA